MLFRSKHISIKLIYQRKLSSSNCGKINRRKNQQRILSIWQKKRHKNKKFCITNTMRKWKSIKNRLKTTEENFNNKSTLKTSRFQFLFSDLCAPSKSTINNKKFINPTQFNNIYHRPRENHSQCRNKINWSFFIILQSISSHFASTGKKQGTCKAK